MSSAPADLASEISSAVAADSSPSSTSPSSYSEQQASGQPQGDGCALVYVRVTTYVLKQRSIELSEQTPVRFILRLMFEFSCVGVTAHSRVVH